MKNEVYTPYSGKAILVGIVVTAIWLAVAVHAYNDSKNEKNEFEVHAGTVTYGTSSSASLPVVSVPMSGVSAPMVSGVSIAIPSLALATPSVVTTQTDASASTRMGMGPRRAPGSAGTYEGEQGEEGGKYWIWDGEEWIEAGDIPVGTTKIEDGITYRWNGSAWETVGEQADPGIPVGNTPWLWMLLLAAFYGMIQTKRKRIGFDRRGERRE